MPATFSGGDASAPRGSPGPLAYVRKNDIVPSKLRHFRTVGGAVEDEARRSFE
jgi:hypothetical protein